MLSSSWGARLLQRQHLAWPLLPWVGPAAWNRNEPSEHGPSTQPRRSTPWLSSQEKACSERNKKNPAVNRVVFWGALLQSPMLKLQLEERSWSSSSVSDPRGLATAAGRTAAFKEEERAFYGGPLRVVSWRHFSGIGNGPSKEGVATAPDKGSIGTSGGSPALHHSFADVQVRGETAERRAELDESSSSQAARQASGSSPLGIADGSKDDAKRENKGTLVTWRDFEDLGSWAVDGSEGPSKLARQASRSSPSDRTEDSRKGAGGHAEQENQGTRVAWHDFEDIGSWVVDESDAPPSLASSPSVKVATESSSVALSGAAQWGKEKKRAKMKKKKQGPPADGEFRLPKARGPLLSEEELGLSFFELCQVPKLRGVRHVEDFLKLSDEDLLRQCDVRMPRAVREENLKGKLNRAANRVSLTHIPTGLTAANDKTRSFYENKKRALLALQEKIAFKVRRQIPEGPYTPPGRVIGIIPQADIHPKWARRKRTRIGPKHAEFPKGAQVLLDLLVCCDFDFARAGEKVRMEEVRFRRLLNQNIHVKHHVRLYKDLRNQRIVQAQTAGLLDAQHQRLVEAYMAGLADKSKRALSKEAEAVETEASV